VFGPAQIHKLADVQSPHIGAGTRIWQFAVVLPGARIGANCSICANCFVENDVVVGNGVTVKSGVALCDGVRLEDDVFVGPNATFTDDPFPRAGHRPAKVAETVVKRGASIGANATLAPGVQIGEGAFVAAGATVTRDVPALALVQGNPARIRGVAGGTTHRAIAGSPPDLPIPGVKLCTLQVQGDARGKLAIAEFGDLPFEPARQFTIYEVGASMWRGNHAHKTCAEFFLMQAGSCRIILDDASVRCEVILSDPSIGLLVPAGTWCLLHSFSPGANVLVLASERYSAAGYVTDYKSFVSFKKSAPGLSVG
jgi:acetyltransferase-like isoleucine patch superfamily enzyme